MYTTRKVSKYGVISRPYFLVLGLNTGKIRTGKNSVFGHFSRSFSEIKMSANYTKNGKLILAFL